MTGCERASRADAELRDGGAPDLPGVTRFDLVCGEGMDAAARDLARGWCSDRAVPGAAADGIVTLVVAAVRHGLRFGPRAVVIGLRWLDPDRVAVDVRWRGCARVAESTAAGSTAAGRPDLELTAAAFDALSESWGLRILTPDPVHWFVVDTA
jgi:hypothetical protein